MVWHHYGCAFFVFTYPVGSQLLYISIYQARWPYWENLGNKDRAQRVLYKKELRADILPVLKVFRKHHGQNFKRAILIGSRLGIYFRLVRCETKQKGNLAGRIGGVYVKAKIFEWSCRIIPVQYLENIRPAKEQSDWSIQVIGP